MRKTSGISLMILIFLSLCLIIFSLLSLSGATADETLSQKAASRTTEYYAAVTSANDILAAIDTELAGYLKTSEADRDSENSYLEACASISDAVPDTSFSDGKIIFSVPVNDNQILQVQLTVTYPQNEDDALYRITSWETVNIREWTADRSQNVYRSESN